MRGRASCPCEPPLKDGSAPPERMAGAPVASGVEAGREGSWPFPGRNGDGMTDEPEVIGAGKLAGELDRLQIGADAVAGLFGPRSMLWRIDRESALFLGAGRALLL